MLISRALALFLLTAPLVVCQTNSLSLAGSWSIKLDPAKLGTTQKWAAQSLPGSELAFLPGSTDEGGFGTRTTGAEKDRLSRRYSYEGPVWYQREVTIPESWRGKRVSLFLERPHWQSEIWVDGRPYGRQNSLSTPHVYDLTPSLKPGKHLLTMLIDNTYKIEVGRRAHSVTDWTQTNWNGVIGRIELRARDAVYIDSLQVYPDPKNKSLRVDARIRNATGRAIEGEIGALLAGAKASAKVTRSSAEQTVQITLPLAENVRLWDEYEPALDTLELTLAVDAGKLHAEDRLSTSVGVRQIATSEKQFLLNGRPIFLRGTLECVIFPKTGYPPMDVESWARLFRIAKEYGLNHFRFHSWCPPEAAFEAADRAGFLLHVELPVWNNLVGKDALLDSFMHAEGHRILKTYGNHPSFTMLCLGNELSGDDKFMDELVAEFKSSDPRRLYTFSADHRRRAAGPTSDYYVTHNTALGPVRIHGSRFVKAAPGTDYDFSEHVKAIPMPLVAHEIGQWVTYPSFDEIAKYTGVLKPRNLEVFRETLAARGMGDQARAFQQASGRFAALVYKEELETAFRTPNFGGFQLLQLQDFPGQGEALIGLLDSFWDSKGTVTPHEFRRSVNDTVALLRMSKFVWTSDETFSAKAQVAHYGRKPITNAVATWVLRDESGRERASGKFPPATLALGSVTTLGEIRMPLAKIERATRLRVTVSIPKTDISNDWDVWVYPKNPQPATPSSALVTSTFDAVAQKRLEEGGKVVLLWPRDAKNESTIAGQFLPVFWSLSFFPKQTGVMGVLCDPKHAALAEFPTDSHSNWQWWELMESSRVFVLNDTPPGYRPIVQVIDDYHRNNKLGAVFETRVGKGKLLVCSLDLATDLSNRPVARQLRQSLLQYVNSDAFRPNDELPAELITKMLRASN